MSIVTRAVKSLGTHGIRRTGQSIACIVGDWLFDRRYATDTMKKVPQSTLKVLGNNQDDARPYFPTRGLAFTKMLDQFQLPKHVGFVDLGSGKGKMLILAAKYGFSNVTGVEFSPELCEVAKCNINRVKELNFLHTKIEIECADVTVFNIEAKHCVFFMFNPFGPKVMKSVAENINFSLQEYPRDIYVIYTLPTFKHDLLSVLALDHVATFEYGGHDFLLFRNVKASTQTTSYSLTQSRVLT